MTVITPDKFVGQDDNPGAILYTDEVALRSYKENRRKRLAAQQSESEINTIKQDVDSIKSDMAELKQLLMKVLESK